MTGINKDVWIPMIQEQYDQEPTFMNNLEDWSEHVDNDVLKIPEAGVDPECFRNSAGPFAPTQRVDTITDIPLDHWDTETTIITNQESKIISYDKVESVTRRHRKALINKESGRATWNLSPQTNTTFTPILRTTGEANALGLKMLTDADVLNHAKAYDKFAPNQEKTLVLTTEHIYELLLTSDILRKQQAYQGAQGEIKKMIYHLYGFKIEVYDGENLYNLATGEKLPYDTVKIDGQHIEGSFSFVDQEGFNATGTLDLFHLPKQINTARRGDEIGLQQRQTASAKRNKYMGAIVPIAAA